MIGRQNSSVNVKNEVSLLVNLIELIYSPKCKSNFYMAIASLMLIHFWVLSTYLVGYLATSPPAPMLMTSSSSSHTTGSTLLPTSFSSLSSYSRSTTQPPSSQPISNEMSKYDLSNLSHHHPLWNLVEVLASLVGGIGMALFFKNVFLIVFESSHLVEAGGFSTGSSSANGATSCSHSHFRSADGDDLMPHPFSRAREEHVCVQKSKILIY